MLHVAVQVECVSEFKLAHDPLINQVLLPDPGGEDQVKAPGPPGLQCSSKTTFAVTFQMGLN